MQNLDATKEELVKQIEQLNAKIAGFEKVEAKLSSLEHAGNQYSSELLENGKRYQDLFEKSQDAILIIKNGKFVDCNRATIKMLHFNKKEDFLNTHPSFLSPEKQPDGKLSLIKADEMMRIAFKNGSHRFEWDHKKSNGEIFPVEVLLTVIENDEKNHILHTVWRDISDRKESEKASKENEEKLRAVFENSTALFYSHTVDHVLTYLSPQVKEILGYTPEEAMIKWTEFVTDNPINEIGFKKTEKAIKTGIRQAPFELELIRKNGEKIWVEVRESPVLVGGKTVSIVGTLSDITDRKIAEKELKESESRFKRLFDDLGDAVFVTSMLGENIGRILEVNPAAVSQTGYSRDELLKMNIINDLLVPGSSEIDTKDWKEKLLSGITVKITEKKRRKNGTEFWTEVVVTSLEFKGEMATLSINHDITSRKLAEDELKQSEEHFRALFENTSIGFYRTTPEGKIILANPALIDLLGYHSFEELAQRNLEKESFDVLNSRNKILDIVDREGYLKGYESVWKIKNEETIHIRENTRAFYDGTGKVKYYEGTIEDISEEKRAELLLKESEEKYHILIDNIQDGVFIIEDGKILFVNEAFAKIVGYTKEEVLGMDFKKLIAPEDWRSVLSLYIKKMKGEYAPNNFEFRTIHKDGFTRVYVNMSIDRINYNNKPVAFGTVRDISENKKMQEQIAIREKYYRALFDLSPSGIIVIDFEGNIIDSNESFGKYLGFSPAELKGRNIRILGGENRQTSIESNIKEILDGKIMRHEVINIAKDGSLRNVELHETKVFLPDGKMGILSIANDITERTRTAQIQTVIYKISYAINLTENLDELISIIREGLGTLIDTTNFFVAIYEEETDTIMLPYMADKKDTFESFPAGKSLTAYVIKTKKPLFATKAVLEELESSGEVESFGSDSEIWLGVPMIINGKVTGAIVVQSYEDENAYSLKDLEILEFVSQAISISISRKKAEQDLLIALEKATESDRLKSTFLATMSHELRTPLNAIIGFSEIIDEESPMEEILEFNKTINSSGLHLLGIVEDIFDITLIETGETRIRKSEENLGKILKDVHEIVKAEQKKIGKDNIKLNQIIPAGGEELSIHTDPSKFKQILINLLKNALKFTKEGYVHYGFSIESEGNKKMLKFYVEDTGIGIPKEKQEIIFDMFRQAEDSHTRVYGGTGIGLSISKKLIEILGGKIWVESDPESNKIGSIFYFTTPLAENLNNDKIEKIVMEGNSLKKSKYDNKTVLVVEDDGSSFEFLKIVLRKAGIEAHWAKNGLEAINFCKENQNIALVLMDINMPEMNGYDATIELKKIRPELAIIAQTAYAISGDKRKALDVGCDAYITKPIDKTELMKIIGKHIK